MPEEVKPLSEPEKRLLGILFDKVSAGMYVYADLCLRHDLRPHRPDIVQQAFIVFMEKARDGNLAFLNGRPLGDIPETDIDEILNPSYSFLLTVMRNHRTGLLRRTERRKRAQVPIGNVPNSGVDPISEVIRSEENARVTAALDSLDDAHREVTVLHYYNGFKSREIAEIIGRPVGTVKRLLHESRESMRETLGHLTT